MSNRVNHGIQFISPTGSIIFTTDISQLVGRDRIKMLEKIASSLNQDVGDVFLETGNRLDNDPTISNGISKAGPGDSNAPDTTGFTVTWRIKKCGDDSIAGEFVSFIFWPLDIVCPLRQPSSIT